MTEPPTLAPGLTGEATATVTDDLTANVFASGTVAVYATPAMIGLIEAAAVRALEGHLPEGSTSVGTHLDVKHLAATPVGTSVILSQGIRLGKTHVVVGVDLLQLHRITVLLRITRRRLPIMWCSI